MKNKHKMAVFSLRIPTALKREVEKRARDEKRSLNQQLIYILEGALAAPEQSAKRQEA